MQKCRGCDNPLSQERIFIRAFYCSKRCRIDFIAKGKKEDWKRQSKLRAEKRRIEWEELYKLESPKCYCGEALPYRTWRFGGRFCSQECKTTRKREHLERLRFERRSKEWEEKHPACLGCGKVIEKALWVGGYQKRKYCSFECKDISPKPNCYRKKSRAYLGVRETRHSGAASEFFVLADLSLKGWDVYRSLSSGSKYDLLVEKNKQVLKIEVRSGWTEGEDRKVAFSTKSLGEPDIFAVVTDEGSSVNYFFGKNFEKTKLDDLGFPLEENPD